MLRLPSLTKLPPLRPASAVLLALVLALATVAGQLLQPRLDRLGAAPGLDATVPQQVGSWQTVPSQLVQAALAVGADGRTTTDQPYDDSLLRTYRQPDGSTVMLALAYGRNQRQEVKIHRPELCYPAQGFQVAGLEPTRFGTLAGAQAAVTGHHMLARSNQRLEAVSYWIRIGRVYSDSAWTTRAHIVREGLAGHVPDGMLVRASQVIDRPEDAPRAFAQLDAFMAELVAAAPPATRDLLVR